MSLILSCLELMKGFKYPDELTMIIYYWDVRFYFDQL